MYNGSDYYMVCRRQTKNNQVITKSININLCKECQTLK